VPNALNLESNLFILLKFAFVPALWRVVLHCSRRKAYSPKRLAYCAPARVIFYRCRGRPPTPPSPLRSVSPLNRFSCARKRGVCAVVGGDPHELFLSLSFSLSLLFALLSALRDMQKAPHHAAVLKNPPACGASRQRRLEGSRAALLLLGAWRAASPARARPVECSAISNTNDSRYCAHLH
jgi:hypothetical protein